MTGVRLRPSRSLRVLLGFATFCPGAAHAQVGSDLLIQPAIPPGFDRGRNVSVVDEPRPWFEPLGITVRSFRVFPRIAISGGATSNAYLTSTAPTRATFVALQPSVVVNSLWSRHLLRLQATGSFREYIGQERRNEQTYDASALGRLDVTSHLSVTGQAQASLSVENLFSGDVTSTVAALSRYHTYYTALLGQYAAGRGRASVAADYSVVRFNPLPLGNGQFRDQSERDREIGRLTGQLEFARTPSFSLFAQAGYGHTNFDRSLFSGNPNRDSNGYRLLGGANFDLAGRARGTIGVGVTYRDYAAKSYQSVRGVSVEGRLELFPSRLVTYTLSAKREIEDSTLGNSQPYFDNRVGVRVDYGIRRNILLNASADYGKQDYIGSTAEGSTYQVGAGARYLTPSRFGVEASVTYAHRSTQGNVLGNGVSELRGQAGIVLQL